MAGAAADILLIGMIKKADMTIDRAGGIKMNKNWVEGKVEL